jgi:hypothetical protein
VPAERIPRGKPPDLARRGEIATKTQELRPALSPFVVLIDLCPFSFVMLA